MMFRAISTFVLGLMICAAANAAEALEFGGDTYLSGFDAELASPGERDVFASGFTIGIDHKIDGNAHAAGADIDIQAPVTGDLEAAALAVRISAPVGRDVSALGASIKITGEAKIGGNARLVAKTLVLEAPVAGSVLAAAQDLRIAAAVSGDVRLVGRAITFAEGARIGGKLFYSAPNPIDIPTSVVSADRIHFEPLSIGAPRASRDWMHVWPATSTILFTAVIIISGLVLIAGLLLSLLPKSSEALQREVIERPFRTMGIGVLGLAMLLGLLPLCVVTLIGLPFVPIVLLAVMALWIGGYLLGVMGLSMRAYKAFRPLPTGLAPKLLLVAVGLIIVTLLNFVPIIGCLLNLAIMFLGLGAILSYAGRSVLSKQSTLSKSDEPRPPSINVENAPT
ncbi:hypothetical protein ACQY1H_24060 (plasmid) [Agrobacterium vitis]|uniref:hypothetical protein n=1 Tax=Agrobacterium vitis TaxID=373 RepID=UPI003D2876D7